MLEDDWMVVVGVVIQKCRSVPELIVVAANEPWTRDLEPIVHLQSSASAERRGGRATQNMPPLSLPRVCIYI